MQRASASTAMLAEAAAFASSSAFVRHTFSHQRQRQQSRFTSLAGPAVQEVRMSASGSRSARQCCAWRSVCGCCRQRRQPCFGQGSAPLDSGFGQRSARLDPARNARTLPNFEYSHTKSSQRRVQMQVRGKSLQARQPYRQGQSQSQPNHSFKRTPNGAA